MVWGAISKKRKSNLMFVKGNTNAEAYPAMFADHRLPFIKTSTELNEMKQFFSRIMLSPMLLPILKSGFSIMSLRL